VASTTTIHRLADGREIVFDAAGPQDGTPVFHFHSLFGCRLIPAVAEAAAQKHGARLISPDRPGIGLSDFQPGRSVLDWPNDVAELADSLGIERFTCFGASAGSPYVLACCLRLPDRVARAAIAGGLTPGAEAGVIHRIVPRVIDPAVKRSLLFSRFVHRLVITGMRKAPDRALASLNKTLPPSDQLVFGQPEIAGYMVECAVEAAHRGLRGWAYDDRILNEPWGFAPADIPSSVPVDLWWGDEDTSMPLARGEQLARDLPNATLHVRPGAGHFGIIFDAIDDIFARLVSGDPSELPGPASTG
jgi:pimeloyl-ACP methyl ester carboxylesterase